MRRKNRAMVVEGLEDRAMMSQLMMPSFQPAAIVQLHATAVHKAQTTTPIPFGGGFVNFSIPFVRGFQVGAAQNAINFTSNTYQNVLFGTGGWSGIRQIANRFAINGNVNQLIAGINALSFRMPFGHQQLLPTWEADLMALQAGTLTPTPSGIHWSFSATGNAVGDVLFHDLQTYLANGLGTSFNILKSGVHWNTDVLLTYNGFV